MSAFMKLSSVSEPDVSCTRCAYVCLIGNITPANMSNVGCESGHSGSSGRRYDISEEVGTSKDEAGIEVQRSVAFHELIESNRKVRSLEDCKHPNVEDVNSKTILMPQRINENSEDDSDDGNPRLLRLTRTKWLSDSRDGSPDARQRTLSPSTSETSSASEENVPSSADRVLSKVLALDKEHNLFGLSNIMIAGPKIWKRHKEKRSKGIFHQTAIVHICYRQCCRRRSKSDLPASLKCGGCRPKCSCARCNGSCTSVCSSTNCRRLCGSPCGFPCRPCPYPRPLPCILPCKKPCPPKPCSICPLVGCSPYGCDTDCGRYGLQITVIKKPPFEPTYTELEPKSPCIQQKPQAARTCQHIPRCLPPSSCFPYLMPCFWPGRSGAPCCEPSHCFHNPPCPKGRLPRGRIVPEERCPIGRPCTGAGAEKNEKCENLSCIGRNNDALKKALTEKYGKK